jgi:hypothetical protein
VHGFGSIYAEGIVQKPTLRSHYSKNWMLFKVKVKISLFQAVEAHRVARG